VVQWIRDYAKQTSGCEELFKLKKSSGDSTLSSFQKQMFFKDNLLSFQIGSACLFFGWFSEIFKNTEGLVYSKKHDSKLSQVSSMKYVLSSHFQMETCCQTHFYFYIPLWFEYVEWGIHFDGTNPILGVKAKGEGLIKLSQRIRKQKEGGQEMHYFKIRMAALYKKRLISEWSTSGSSWLAERVYLVQK